MQLEFHKKHPKQHQHATIGGLSFETSTKPLNQKIVIKSCHSIIVNEKMQKNFSFLFLMFKNLFKLQVSHAQTTNIKDTPSRFVNLFKAFSCFFS